MSRGDFNAIRQDIRDTLVVWQDSAQVPGFLMLLAPALQDAGARRLVNCPAMFHATDEGREFFAATGFRLIRRVTPDGLAEPDSIVPKTRRLPPIAEH